MKRIGNLFPQLLDINLINFADACARKGKHNFGIYKHDKHKEEDKKNVLRGIRCRWFTVSGELQEAVFNTKDLLLID